MVKGGGWSRVDFWRISIDRSVDRIAGSGSAESFLSSRTFPLGMRRNDRGGVNACRAELSMLEPRE